MDAMQLNIRVIGAGNLGALRAKELQQFGMTGVGKVFEGLTDEENDYTALHSISSKTVRKDAVEAIRHAFEDHKNFAQPDCSAFRKSFTEHKWRRGALLQRPCVVDGKLITGAQILQQFSATTPIDELTKIRQQIYTEFYALEWARLTGTTCPEKERNALFEKEHEYLHDATWLLSNGLMQCEYASLLDENALLNHLNSTPWDEYVEGWADIAGIIMPDNQTSTSRYEWIISKNPSFFGYIWEYEVGLWEWLQRNKKVATLAAALQPAL